MKKSLVVLLLAIPVYANSMGSSVKYGDWSVSKASDDMDVIPIVVLSTKFVPEGRSGSIDLTFGFRRVGKNLVDLNTSAGFLSDTSWPRCAQDGASASIDGAKAVMIATVNNPGDCNLVSKSGAFIKQLLSGKSARVRVGYDNGSISLDGFKEAWAAANKLSSK